MKTEALIFLTSLTAILCAAETINIRLPRQNFYAGTASYTDTTNTLCPVVPLSGYFYPSNFVGVTRWSFDGDIITSTNPVISLKFLTTNTALINGVYRLVLYTNNLNTPFYDSGEVTLSSIITPATTNLQVIKVTNNIPINSVTNRANVLHGSVYYKNIAIVGTWDSKWLIGGSIQFQ